MSKKKFISSKKLYIKNDNYINYDEHSDSSTKEEEIKHKKQMRTEIMKQIRHLKIKSIKDIQKSNNIQNKQKKKYGGVKSRFLDVFYEHQKYFKLLNFLPNKQVSCNKSNNSRYKEEVIFPSTQRKISINSSKISYYNNNSLKNSNYIKDEKNVNNFYYMNTQSSFNIKERNSLRNSFIEFLKSSKNNLERSKITNNKNKISKFTTLELINKNNTKNTNKNINLFSFYHHKKNNKDIFKVSNNYSNRFIKRPKSNINYKNDKKYDTKSFINKLEKKRNKEFLENLLYRRTNKNDYNYSSKLYELFKKTECF